MRMYYVNNDAGFYVNGMVQTRCKTASNILKSFIQEDFPMLSEPLIFELEKNAILTDCLSQSGIMSKGILVNNNLKNTLEKYEMANHEFYESFVIDKSGCTHEYFWLQIKEDFNESIDFDKSEFIELNITTPVDPIRLGSINDYYQKKEKIGWNWDVKPIKICLKTESRLFKLDLFRLFPLISKIIVSERLKETIEKSNTLGLSFEEIDLFANYYK